MFFALAASGTQALVQALRIPSSHCASSVCSNRQWKQSCSPLSEQFPPVRLVLSAMPLATVALEAPAIAVKLESGSSHKSTLSKKVPAPVRTGNEETDKARKDEFDDLVEVIDILTEFPQLRAQAVRQLRSQLGGLREKIINHGMELVPNAAKTLGQFIKSNEPWCVSWLSHQVPDLSTQQQAIAKDKDRDAVAQQMFFLLKASGTWQLPPEAKYAAVAHALFNKRVLYVGSRSRLLSGSNAFVLESGALNWKLGCYEALLHVDGAIVEVLHRPSGVRASVCADEGLDSSWGIANNFCDAHALFVKGTRQTVRVDTFFAKKVGPWQHTAWTGKADVEVCVAAAATLEALRQGQAVVSSTEIEATRKTLDEPAAAKRKEAAARARTKLEAGSAALKRLRVLPVA